MIDNLQPILDDLYAVAPELRDKEAEIRVAISELLSARPNVKLDESYQAELRMKLLQKFYDKPVVRVGSNYHFSISRTGIFGGAAIGLAIVVMMVIARPKTAPAPAVAPPSAPVTARLSLNMGGTVTETGDQAFGRLGAATATTSANEAAGSTVAKSAALAAPETAVPPATDLAAPVSPMPIVAPLPPLSSVHYEYHYPGDLKLPSGSVTVLKTAPQQDLSALTSHLSDANLGFLDLGKLNNPVLQNLVIGENRDRGYQVNVDFTNGTAYITQNWSKWPTPGACAPDSRSCPAPRTAPAAEMPTSQETLSIAKTFLTDLGVDTGRYGSPSVINENRLLAPTTAAPAVDFFSERLTVLYPLLVNGRTVYDEGGNPQGLSVNIDARTRTVTDAGPISLQNYLASTYPAENDGSLVHKFILNGGAYGERIEAGQGTVTKELDAPQEGYVVVWQQAADQMEQVFLPALIFPVKDYDQAEALGYGYPKNIVVPLVKDYYETAAAKPQPSPYSGAASSGSIGSGSAVEGGPATVVPPTPATPPQP